MIGALFELGRAVALDEGVPQFALPRFDLGAGPEDEHPAGGVRGLVD